MTAYPVPMKRKSFDLCLAFVRGCGGQIGTTLRDGPAVFYGIDKSNIAIWKAVKARGDDWYCIDNSYFDATRQRQFRVTKNDFQHSGIGVSDGKRFKAMGIDIKPWRTKGEHIVICEQSEGFMRDCAGYDGNWLNDTLAALKPLTEREVRVRRWTNDKVKLGAGLQNDLVNAHALVTWASAAAVTATLQGIPAVTMGHGAAWLMGGALKQINCLPTPDGRENWSGVLADNEFTTEELRDGTAWHHLQS